MNNFKHIYGPVYSWRLGMSLGVDPLSKTNKVCNLDCVYCQLGRTTQFCNEREIYVTTHEIIEELNQLPGLKLDTITISGRGEPTLALNLGHIIHSIRQVRKEKIAVITNSTLMDKVAVRNDLRQADCVIAKIDAFDQSSFMKIDKPERGLEFERIIEGIKKFRSQYRGKLALQIMFLKSNKRFADQMAKLVKELHANEIEINTPLRPCAEKPLNMDELKVIKRKFDGLPAVTVYEKDKKEYKPLSERDTIKRHGNYKKSCD